MSKSIFHKEQENEEKNKKILRMSQTKSEIIKTQLKAIDVNITNELIERLEYIKNNSELVPRIKKRDYLIAIVINVAITVLYFILIMS
ncbi:MAG: hypothetical protein RQ968_05160 [Thermoproteota archaeon]|jgi:hypothetical protein|nr:hypothetical protein [Thermoproteota archaeon]